MWTKTGNVSQKINSKTNYLNAMKEKSKNTMMNSQEIPTSTQFKGSETSAKSRNKANSSTDGVIEKEERFDNHEIKGTPFRIVGTPGSYTLCVGMQAVSPRPFKNLKEATMYVNKKPWDLILITTKIYSLMWDENNKKSK